MGNRMHSCVCVGPVEKSLEEMWIELSFLGAHLFGGARVRQAVSIRSRGGQRIINVGDAENPSGEGNLLAGETVGISVAVPPLVVVPDDRTYISREINVRDEFQPRLRVALHDRPFLIGESARLVQ